MNPYEPTALEPTLPVRHFPDEADDPHASTPLQDLRRRIFFRTLIALTALALVLSLTAFFAARFWAHKAMRDSLPQLDGSLAIAGLSAPVTIQRDARGVPYIRATCLNDLLIAQGFVTAEDRLWQMDLLRRHAAGQLAEILGPALVPHDRIQRTLQIGTAADRALSTLTPDQLHQLQSYAKGVNDAIEAQRA
ncbi:MAG: penicillin acylase family protein, partial [Edaphobacter sp.]